MLSKGERTSVLNSGQRELLWTLATNSYKVPSPHVESKIKLCEPHGRYLRYMQGGKTCKHSSSSPCSQLARPSGSFGLTAASGKGKCRTDSSRCTMLTQLARGGWGVKSLLLPDSQSSEADSLCQVLHHKNKTMTLFFFFFQIT